MSQRFVISLLVLVIMIGFALVGEPIDLDNIQELVMSAVIPLAALATVFVHTIRAINHRVNNGLIMAGDLQALPRTTEFWTVLLATVFTGVEAFGLDIIEPEQQRLIVDSVLTILAIFSRDIATTRLPQQVTTLSDNSFTVPGEVLTTLEEVVLAPT